MAFFTIIKYLTFAPIFIYESILIIKIICIEDFNEQKIIKNKEVTISSHNTSCPKIIHVV